MLVAALPRVLSALLLPNAFGDAYAYVRDIQVMSERIRSGTFSLEHLYGFWLPLYQFICALVSVPLGHADYVAKMVSAWFGVGVCMMVYDLSVRLTADRRAAWLTFALIAVNPLHVFNSASAMTDVPHAFFVLASACFVLRGRWTCAAIFAALAGLTRMDSWMLLVLLPLLQLLRERRVSLVALTVLLFPPLFWLYLSWKATGDWLACFAERRQYMDWLLSVNPSLASFSLYGIGRDAGALLLSTDLCVLAACILAARLVYKRGLLTAAVREVEASRAVFSLNLFFFAYLGFILLAYLTHRQPIIFPRYGLILFALGLPILPWTFLELTRRKTRFERRAWLMTIVAVCLLSAGIQFTYSAGFVNREYARRSVADYLRAHFNPDTGARIFNDEGTVLAVSGIPTESFLSSTDAPRERSAFIAYLKEKNVEYLVYIEKQDSTPARLFPELKEGRGDDTFEPVMRASSRFLREEIWLYKIHAP
jgi:hypothetical protein